MACFVTRVVCVQASQSAGDGTILRHIALAYHPAFNCRSCRDADALLSRITTQFPSAHSIFQTPGRPLRTFSNSTCHRGKPTPGIPSSSSLGKGVIFHRLTQAVVFAFLGEVRRIKPVTLLCSTTSWSR